MNTVYDDDTVTFWFHRFHSGIFNVKNASRTCRPLVDDAHKITYVTAVDRHVSSRSMAQKLKIDQTGLKRMLHV